MISQAYYKWLFYKACEDIATYLIKYCIIKYYLKRRSVICVRLPYVLDIHTTTNSQLFQSICGTICFLVKINIHL